MAKALWELYANQKTKGLVSAMRHTLAKLEKLGFSDALWFNAMGELAQMEKNFTTAARFFKQAFDEKPNPEFELNWGNALFYAGDFLGSKKILAGYFVKHPDDVHGLVNLANCKLRLGELKEVEEICEAGLKRHLSPAPLLNCIGQAAFLFGNADKAWIYFDKAYADAPDSVDALFNRGNMAYQLGRREEALRDFAQCLRKDENYESALLNSAVIQLEMGEWEKGKTCVHQALKLDGQSVEAHHLLGRLHLDAGEFRSARDSFKNALKRDPNHISTLLALAKLHIQEAEEDEASAVLKRVLTKKNLGTEERRATLTLLLELGQYATCIRSITNITESEQGEDLKKILVFSLWKSGRIKEAISNLEKLLQNQGEDSGTLILLGQMLAQSGAEGLAEARYSRALELEPESQAAACELARIKLARGEGEKAIEILQAILKANPQDPDCQYNLACCYAKNQNFDDCLYNLKQALANGFQDIEKINADEDLQYIRQFEEYNQLAQKAGLA